MKSYTQAIADLHCDRIRTALAFGLTEADRLQAIAELDAHAAHMRDLFERRSVEAETGEV